MKNNIKALYFDVFGTVTDWRSSVISECQKTTERLNIELDWGEFVDKWRLDGYIDAPIKISSRPDGNSANRSNTYEKTSPTAG